jgi:hypothetical protein
MYTINFWPILIAAVVSFGIGALWYSPILFGKEWMALTKKTDSDMQAAKSGIWKFYLIQFVMTIIMFIVIGFVISAIGVARASDGAFVGFLAWIGLIAPVSMSNLMWKKEPGKLVLIETINYLVVLAIGGAIIGAWR